MAAGGHIGTKSLAFHTRVWTNGGMDTNQNVNIPSHTALATYPYAELKAMYEELLHRQPPTRASADFLRGNIAWVLQALDQKQDPATQRQALVNQANRPAIGTRQPVKAGTRLIREWQGHTHEVAVLDSGYLWQGGHYRSLSRIAKEITGTRWSGPRFFGLKEAGK